MTVGVLFLSLVLETDGEQLETNPVDLRYGLNFVSRQTGSRGFGCWVAKEALTGLCVNVNARQKCFQG